LSKHRVKRKSNSLERYLKNPEMESGFFSQNVKVKNPVEEFEKEEAEKAKPFEIPAAEPKTEEVKDEIIEFTEIPIDTEKDYISELPVYCNHCEIKNVCPNGKSVLRKDQKKLVVCSKRQEFRQLIQGANTNTREGLLKYIHNLRSLNSLRMGRFIYKESILNGHDRNLSVLIDKQIDNAMAEIKLITPAPDKNTNNFSFHLSTVHKTVDTYNELPAEIKTYLLQSLRAKLNQLKTPKENANELLNSIISNNTILIPNNNISTNTNNKVNVSLSLNDVGGRGGGKNQSIFIAENKNVESEDEL
jgi:hypothetical protein